VAFDHLKVKPLQRASSSWANAVVDALNQLYDIGEASVKYEDLKALGYDIVPDQDNLRRLGDPSRAWSEVNAHIGYFIDDAFVQGKKVLKDGDPINLYDIYDPANEKITQAIDQSRVSLIEQYARELGRLPSIEQYTRETRDVAVRLRIDEYGNVGVVITEPIDAYGNVPVSPRDIDEDLIPLSRLVDTSAESSPLTLITPPSDKRVDVRRAYVSTDSTAGKIYVKFKNTGRVITAIYPTKYGFAIMPAIRIYGDLGEEVVLEWSDLSTGSEILVIMNYKLIP